MLFPLLLLPGLADAQAHVAGMLAIECFLEASLSESVLANAANMRAQATDWSANQCPPSMKNRASRLAATPVALNRREFTDGIRKLPRTVEVNTGVPRRAGAATPTG